MEYKISKLLAPCASFSNDYDFWAATINGYDICDLDTELNELVTNIVNAFIQYHEEQQIACHMVPMSDSGHKYVKVKYGCSKTNYVYSTAIKDNGTKYYHCFIDQLIHLGCIGHDLLSDDCKREICTRVIQTLYNRYEVDGHDPMFVQGFSVGIEIIGKLKTPNEKFIYDYGIRITGEIKLDKTDIKLKVNFKESQEK